MPGTDAKEAVLGSYAALNERDIDAAMEALAEDAEWHESEVLPDTGVYRGREAIRAFLTDFLASWERFHQTIEEIRQEGDRVLVMIHLEATGEARRRTSTPATRTLDGLRRPRDPRRCLLRPRQRPWRRSSRSRRSGRPATQNAA